MKRNLKSELSQEQQDELIVLLNQFLDWLLRRKVVADLSHIEHRVDYPASTEDWTMRVDAEKKAVSFNTNILNCCSYDYYRSILIHELFHLVVQKVPNKEDAVRVKDDFGDEFMKLIDIEADFFTALFFKEELNFTLVEYLALYYEGSKAFQDKKIRAVKLERFIGTLLTIAKLFIDNPKTKKEVPNVLFLPSISPIYTENSLHVLVVKKEHVYFDQIQASYQDFVEIKTCYTDVDNFSKVGYISKLIAFIAKAFKIDIPENISVELNNLKIESNHDS